MKLLITTLFILITMPAFSDVWIGKYREGLQGIISLPKSPIVLNDNHNLQTIKLKAVFSNGNVVDITEESETTFELDVWQNAGIYFDSSNKRLYTGGIYDICRAALIAQYRGFTTIIHIAAYDFSANPDGDNDKIPNSWEDSYNLNTNDSADASADNDNDGINNLLEFVLDTNPGTATNYPPPPYNWRDEDDDGDGMPNGWEWDNNLPPHRFNANEDADGDGLTDYEEYLAGSDPQVSNKHLLMTIPGAETNNSLGKWEITGDEIFSTNRRGFVEYKFNLTEKNMLLFEVEYKHSEGSLMFIPPFFIFSIDENEIEKQKLKTGFPNYSLCNFFSYVLTPGAHSLKIFWDNFYLNEQVNIKEVRIYEITGPDDNNDNIKNWIDNKLNLLCSVNPSCESYISPLCLEGNAKFINLMSITTNSLPVNVYHGAGNKWYANISLNTSNIEKITINFQNNSKSLVKKIKWSPLNILQSNDIIIRKNDSLLLTAHPEFDPTGTMDISINGSRIARSQPADIPVIYKFTESGDYTLRGEYYKNDTVEKEIKVTVIDYSPPDFTPYCMLDYFDDEINDWYGWRNVPFDTSNTNVYFETDGNTFLHLSEFYLYDSSIDINKPGNHYIIARAGKTGGIITNFYIHSFVYCINPLDCYVKKIDNHLVEFTSVAYNLPDEVIIRQETLDKSIRFYDNNGTERIITTNNFTPLGENTYKIKTSSDNESCNFAVLMQNDEEEGGAGPSNPDDNESLNVKINGEKVVIPNGTYTNNCVVSKGEPPYTYSWSDDGGTQSFAIYTMPETGKKTITCDVVDTNGLTGKGELEVKVVSISEIQANKLAIAYKGNKNIMLIAKPEPSWPSNSTARWEKKVDNGEWKSAGTGRTNFLLSSSSPGKYLFRARPVGIKTDGIGWKESTNLWVVKVKKLAINDETNTQKTVFYVLSDTNDNAKIKINVTPEPEESPKMSREFMLWKIEGSGKAEPESACFAANDSSTLKPTGSSRKFKIKAGVDKNYDQTLQANEINTEIEVIVVGVKLKEISFTENKNIISDKGKEYNAPHWIDSDINGKPEHNYPIAYVRNNPITLSAEFEIKPNLPADINLKMKLTGDANIYIPEAEIDRNGKLSVTSSKLKLPNLIDYYNSAGLYWSVSFSDKTNWIEFAETKHDIYVLLGEPIATLYHTVVHISCKAAKGLKDVKDIFNKIWGIFAGAKNQIHRASDGKLLTYYADYRTRNTSVASLLANGDGQCLSWAMLFRYCLMIQTIESGNIDRYPPNGWKAFFVKQWGFSENGISKDVNYNYMNLSREDDNRKKTNYDWLYADVYDLPGISGQGNNNPASIFGCHFTVKINNILYDPSYGVIYSNHIDLEHKAIAALYKKYLAIINELDYSGIDLNNNGKTNDIFTAYKWLIKKN